MLTDKGKRIVEEAKQKKMWIYDSEYKRRYSPEEFSHVFHFANANDEWIAHLQIRHPTEGIQAGFKRLAEVHTKLQRFITQVMAYYNR